MKVNVYAVKKGGRSQEFTGDESRLEDWLQRMLGGEISFIDPEDEMFPLLFHKSNRHEESDVNTIEDDYEVIENTAND